MRRTVFPLSKGRRFEHGLSFLATLAFLGGFFGARLFHLAFPSLMVITQGIHFHHFWYGLAMMGVAGWLGIVDNDEKFARVYAVVFGVGAGFVGDEVGLLLTFDDYYSELTLEFLVAAVAFLILVALMIRYRTQILEEVFHLSRGERLTHVGVFLIGFSALSFAFGIFELGTPLVRHRDYTIRSRILARAQVGTKERLLTMPRARPPQPQRESEPHPGNGREVDRYDNSRGPSPARMVGALGKEERG